MVYLDISKLPAIVARQREFQDRVRRRSDKRRERSENAVPGDNPALLKNLSQEHISEMPNSVVEFPVPNNGSRQVNDSQQELPSDLFIEVSDNIGLDNANRTAPIGKVRSFGKEAAWFLTRCFFAAGYKIAYFIWGKEKKDP